MQWHGLELQERACGISDPIQGKGWLVLGKSLPVGELGILLLQPSTVEQDEFGDVPCGWRRENLPAEPVQHQSGEISTMIQVRVRQYNRIDVLGLNDKMLPVQLAQVLQSLEKSAVDQDAGTAICDQVFVAGDGTGTAQAGQ